MSKRTRNQFIVVRNGEHLDVCDTAEAASRALEAMRRDDERLHQAGWTKASPDQISYYVLPR